jgi:hypothetical protein
MLLLIQPIIPAYFGMSSTWKSIYIIFLFGFPILILLPIAVIVSPFALILKRKQTFQSFWLKSVKYVFIVFGCIILLINSLFLFSKYIVGKDPFPLDKYSEITGFSGNIEDLKVGEFETEFSTIKRDDNVQVEIYKNQDSSSFKVDWVSQNEYRLINQGRSNGMNDTLLVKITNNTSEFYECYLKFGQYAQYMKISKN